MESEPPGGCLGTDTLLAFVEGRATADARAEIEQHASRCAECRRVLSALARDAESPARGAVDAGDASTIRVTPGPEGDQPTVPDRARGAVDGLVPGDMVARYVVRARLGAGGMGVVYAAHDPELGREVAIKLLAPGLGSSAARTMFEERLRREARALAQLAHPNVVAVHDVGKLDDRLFIAMELLDGETLARWCRRERRPAREILEHFVAAGRGLAAAHAAGIVHRDVKPENMMLGSDGRVRVVDFGLARTSAGEVPAALVGAESAETAADPSLTATGAVMGTPSYMAPEQHRGEEVDARTDQFAFCVAVYVALFDLHPFAGDDVASLARAVEAGAIREPPRRKGLPRRVLRALRRGMSPSPAARFASLEELLAELAPPRRARWVPLASGGAAIVVLAATAVLVGAHRAEPPRPCEGMDVHLAGIWDPLRRAEVTAALRASGAPFADAAAHTVGAQLDDYAARWVTTRTDVCMATRVRGEQTAETMNVRMQCLDDRLRDLDALVAELLHGDRSTAAHAVAATYRLADLSGCEALDAVRYRAQPPHDPALVASVRAKLSQVRALDATGRYREGIAALAALAPQVTAAAYRPLEAEDAWLEGTLRYDADQPGPATAALQQAVLAAEACAYDDIAGRALTQLIHVYAEHGKFADAEAARARASSALERSGHAPGLAADLDYATGVLADMRGDLDGAEVALQRAVKTAESMHGTADLGLAVSLVALGQVELQRMNGQAAPYLERARQIDERLLGPDHPDLATVQVALGGVAYEHADYDGAAAHYERAIAILEHALGRENPQVANTLSNLAEVRQWQGRADDALAEIREAIAIDEKVLPAADPQTAMLLTTEADVLEQLDRHADALAVIDRDLAMLHALYQGDHQDIAGALHSRALIELALGRLDAALADGRASLAMYGRIDASYPTGELARNLGRIELARHDPAAALGYLEQAMAHPRPDADASDAAWASGLYGLALVESGRDRTKGTALVEAAYATLHGDERAGENARELELGMRAAHIAIPGKH